MLERISTGPGLEFDVIVDGPQDGALVLLLHGFAESFHTWDAQIAALARADYRAVAPSQRGYSAGARPDPANAERLAAKLRGGGYGKIFVRDDLIAGRKMYRVRIGPVPDVPEFDRIVAALEHAGVHDAHLALD